ncbi:hypothetical protein [Actinacidiphila reveromycinica]|uniref:hypothetical protein n=1 Tax=Actinacidiphila reveromycinica TaxID=659352 RepID=UPI00192219D1|nr:hypothetical protein [Streptomyces sp. SN-593]
MTTSWRRRVLGAHRAEVEEWLAGESEEPRDDDDAVDSERRAEWLTSVRRWNPDAHFREELTIRLTGDEAGRGGLKFSVGNALLKPLQEGVTASTDEDVELELVGVSSGSTVLHVRPVTHDEAELPEHSEVEAAEDQPTASHAIGVLLDAVKTIEAREDVSEWTPMLSSLSKLVSALDRFDLGVQLRWFADDGSVTSSKLSEAGKQYVRELRKTHGAAFTRVTRRISGNVTEMKISGAAVIKPPSSPAVTIKFEPGVITEVPWRLGDEVHLVVEERTRLTRGGGRPITEYLFLSTQGQEEGFEPSALPDVPVSLREHGDDEGAEAG